VSQQQIFSFPLFGAAEQWQTSSSVFFSEDLYQASQWSLSSACVLENIQLQAEHLN